MSASANIDKVAKGLSGWQAKEYVRLRDLINDADDELDEDWKWDTAVWTKKGNVVALGVFKEHLKLNFFKGALIEDPHGLFNAGLDAKSSRSIDVHEGDKIDERALQELLRRAADVKLPRKKLDQTAKDRLSS
ncbi:MAG: DUF1801 domain-containing protein [Chloroflexota bacterium]